MSLHVLSDAHSHVDNNCAICLKEYQEAPVETECGHFFDFSCLAEWFKIGKDSCPLCRKKVSLEKITHRPDILEITTALFQFVVAGERIAPLNLAPSCDTELLQEHVLNKLNEIWKEECYTKLTSKDIRITCLNPNQEEHVIKAGKTFADYGIKENETIIATVEII